MGLTELKLVAKSDHKVCCGCGESKDKSCFSKNRASKDGLCARCRACEKVRYNQYRESSAIRAKRNREANPEKYRLLCRQYRQKHPERVREYRVRYREENKEKARAYAREYRKKHRSHQREVMQAWKRTTRGRFQSIKSDARKRGWNFEIDYSTYQRIAMRRCFYCGDKFNSGLPMGVDRFDSQKGYVEGNVFPCCAICNRMKLDHTFMVFLKQCHKILARWGYLLRDPVFLKALK